MKKQYIDYLVQQELSGKPLHQKRLVKKSLSDNPRDTVMFCFLFFVVLFAISHIHLWIVIAKDDGSQIINFHTLYHTIKTATQHNQDKFFVVDRFIKKNHALQQNITSDTRVSWDSIHSFVLSKKNVTAIAWEKHSRYLGFYRMLFSDGSICLVPNSLYQKKGSLSLQEARESPKFIHPVQLELGNFFWLYTGYNPLFP
jgi:hypothetical protein